MDIKTINTNMGDCHIITCDNISLSVDYGSMNLSKLNYGLYIGNLKDKKYGLITHFHEDHYNGYINHMNNYLSKNQIWDEFYLPNLFVYDSLWDNPFAQMIFISVFGMNGYSLTKIEKILNLLEGLRSNSKLLIGKGKGDKIILNRLSIDVIWPEYTNLTVIKQIKNIRENYIVKSYINRIKKDFSDEGEFPFDDVESLIQDIREYYNTIVISSKENHIKEIERGIVPQTENIPQLFNRIKDKLSSLNEKLDAGNLNDLVNSLYYSDSSPKTELRLKNICHFVTKNIDNHSLLLEYDNKLLMLGDVMKNVYEKHIQPSLQSKFYRVIKSSHHGTESRFFNKYPSAENLIICHGAGAGNTKKIDDRYNYYNPVLFHRVLCTDGDGTISNTNRCNAVAKGNRCMNSLCSYRGEINSISI